MPSLEMKNGDNRISVQDLYIEDTDHKKLHDYSDVLRTYGVKYRPSEYYWLVGEITKVQGWILHLSVVHNQLNHLLKVLIPELLKGDVAFKIVRDSGTASYLLEGSLGYMHLGKLVCIYSENEHFVAPLAQNLIKLTSEFKGPAIPTDRHLGGIVYTRYGSFNPVVLSNNNGEMIKHIFDDKGELICDKYSIPFALPKGIVWPFPDIVPQKIPKTPKLLNRKYYPLEVVKSNVKGDVIKAIYFDRFFHIKSCLIKQGRNAMAADDAGRDIVDRLKWQYEIHQALATEISMPKAIEFFSEESDGYLVIQFIDAISLGDWLYYKFNNRAWCDISINTRLTVLDSLLTVLGIIRRLHEKGYIHRDITSDNFLVYRDRTIYCIDLELCWSSHSEIPNPPFHFGTVGYMSPEQIRMGRPTVQQDIYAIGALMIVFFTNLQPVKYDTSSPEELKQKLFHFLIDRSVCDMIGRCMDPNPNLRPSISAIESVIKAYRDQLETASKPGHRNSVAHTINDEHLSVTIQSGINGLALAHLLSPQNEWVSKLVRNEQYTGHSQEELTLYEGWHAGMAGPLWLTALAQKAGFDISRCKTAFINSWEYIYAHYFKEPKANPPGLFQGGAGIALALAASMNSGLMPIEDAMARLSQCFTVTSNDVGISTGIAGQGIALLYSANWLEHSKMENQLITYVDTLLLAQGKNGSWGTSRKVVDNLDSIDLASGDTGILLFLLSYLHRYPNQTVEDHVCAGLHWLIKCEFNKDKIYLGERRTRSREKPERIWERKFAVLLCLIRAYQVLKMPLYKEIAEINLRLLPKRPVLADLSLESGTSGLGEVLLEACETFNDPDLQERADWAAQILMTTFQKAGTDSGYWLVDKNNNHTAELAMGNSGILHFLIRYQQKQEFGHPFCPNYT